MPSSRPDLSVDEFSPSRRLVAVFCVVIAIAGGAGLVKGLATPFANPWRELDRASTKVARQPAVPMATGLSSSTALGAFLVTPPPKPKPRAAPADLVATEAENEGISDGLAILDPAAVDKPLGENTDEKAMKSVPASASEGAPATAEPAVASDSASAV